MNVFLTIIIPTYNSGQFLHNCLQSIQNQKFNNYEVIIVDAGSHDQTKQVAKSFDNRFKFYELVGSTQGEARNLGIKESNGKFIMFLDSDDSITNHNVFQNCYDLIIQEADVDFYNFCISFKKNNKVVKNIGSSYKGLLKDSIQIACLAFYGKEIHTVPWNKIYKKMFLDQHSILFPLIKEQEDMVFAIECSMFADKVYFSDINIVTADIRDSSLSRSMSSSTISNCFDALKIIEKKLKSKNLYEIVFNEFNIYKMRSLSYLLFMALYRIDSNKDFYQNSKAIYQSKVLDSKISFFDIKMLKLSTFFGIIAAKSEILVKVLRFFKKFKLIKGY